MLAHLLFMLMIVGVENSNIELNFERKELFASDAKISSEIRGSGIFYQTEKGEAVLSVFENSISFTYHENGNTYFLTSGKFAVGKKFSGDNLLSYKQSDVKSKPALSCGTQFMDKVKNSVDGNMKSGVDPNPDDPVYSNVCRIVKIACEVEDNWSSHWGGFVTGRDFMYNIMNNVDSYYRTQMGIDIDISDVIGYANSDPYDDTDPIDAQTLINEIRDYWVGNHGSVVRDGTLIFTYQEITAGGNAIGGITYDLSKYLCNNNAAYALIGENGNIQNSYYYWITAHELGHLAGHDGHDSNPVSIMNGSSITTSTFTSYSKNLIWNKFENTLDELCIVNNNIRLRSFNNYLPPNTLNQVCTFDWGLMTAYGNHSITWAFTSNNTGASLSSSTGISNNLNYGNSGYFTLKLSKSNDCGSTERFYPFQVNSCAKYSYYPNEVSNNLTVSFEEALYNSLPDEIYLVSDKGEKIASKSPKKVFKNKSEAINDELIFDLKNESNGIYFLKVYFKDRKNNNIETHRILKTN